MTSDFVPFPKIPRLLKGDIVVTEKIDGTNAQIVIDLAPPNTDDDTQLVAGQITVQVARPDSEEPDLYTIRAGSRNRWLKPGQDNSGFFAWVLENAQELVQLGDGQHFGEWFGKGIQRGYGLAQKHFALFNVGRWFDPRSVADPLEAQESIPFVPGLTVVPVLYRGPWFGGPSDPVREQMRRLEYSGSTIAAAANFPAEGIMVYHEASGYYFKVPFDSEAKGAR